MLGDYNFRIDMKKQAAIDLIESQNLEKLKEQDQLLKNMEAYPFPHFNEAEIKFNPTYKFDPGTDVYDTSKK
jgi:inositol-1,4,5-trisphosphate 5-phosphatase